MPVIGVTADLATLEEFTHWRVMLQGIAELQAVPLLIDREQAGGVRQWVGRIDGLLLSGGGDVAPLRYGHADADAFTANVSVLRDDFEESLYRTAVNLGVPVLAICRGMQLVNVIHGGTLVTDLGVAGFSAEKHRPGLEQLTGPAHEASVEPGSYLERIFAGLPQTGMVVNSQHHQVLNRLGTGVARSAQAYDGTVEAIEIGGPAPRAVGVQWHPEVDWPSNAHSRRLLERFVDAARARENSGAAGWEAIA
ncbi:gamma-glutamyl-gamma-aminobutyrate hydrolase family protein [Sediminivirga luteola]|uniref:Gamma-glutamyl-gamma-aminobutyrate hydrolase n=1 Tax=Sediminivirga luteola TaxID=1774748 RepID=A0A8J2TV17_9MICO|nr:gamma-glutamyl-gamma-aminobutyrate hydrolase family protein [Sediminivirga luteola]MCI2264676.1 gamma-glutamyl-gamma-aminobutyrate hydrolase family protein [Sediminivirga luteola]GGA02566.1 gamma-glutamyl-gamma-aminobutyrate hydrolase [Sediminivirga luteola]